VGMYDEVEGILEPYSNQFKLWDCTMSVYKSGDAMPSVGMANTYAVRLDGAPDTRPCYLWVQEGHLTNLMALQPIGERAVFDKWGKCLGRGGEKLDPPGLNPVAEAVGIVQEILEQQKVPRRPQAVENKSEPDPSVSEIAKEADSKPKTITELVDELKELGSGIEPPEYKHEFRLRHDLEIKLTLPVDLTQAEADRIALFVKSLPIQDD